MPAIKAVFSFLYVFIIILLATGCADKKKDVQANYSLYVLAKDGTNHMIQTNTLDSGMLKPEADGISLETVQMDRNIIVKNHNYYYLDPRTASFSKFKIGSNLMKTSSAVQLQDFTIENFSWLKGDTLLLTGLNISGYNQPKFVLLNTANMEVIAKGDLDIPKPSGKFGTMSLGFVEKRNDQIFIGYTYHVSQDISNFETSDTLYVSQLRYPQMNLLNTEKDTRSTYPGGQNTVQPSSFSNDKGDYYFITCPGIAMGNRPEIKSGIFRIKKDQSVIDTYFFNISESIIKNHAYGMWYLGGNKAIIRTERKDLFKDLNDHYKVAQFEFYVIDLQTKAIKKLNLPLDKGTRKQCVIVQNGIAYIAVNSAKEGNFIWLYDIQKDSLKKGLQLAGNTDYILRIDTLGN